MPQIRRTLIASAAFLGLAAPAATAASNIHAEHRSDRTAVLEQRMDALVAAGVPGAVLLVRDGRSTMRLAAGKSDISTGTAMRVGDRFRVASLTKTFAATIVMQLVDEGRLSLEDSIDHWLPGAVPNGANITVRQLLGHQSGLFDYQNDARILEPYLSGDFGYFWSPLALLDVSNSHPPMFVPGAGVSYSATGYVVVGLIIEAVTGHSMGDEMRTRLFRPLGLRSTSYPTSPRIGGRHAHGYLNVPGQPLLDVTGISPSYYWTTGNIVSTVRDIGRFYRALFGGRLVSGARLAEMQTTRPDARGVDWGLGLYRGHLSCGAYWGHDGAAPGYLSVAFESPDQHREVVALVNSMTFDETPGDGAAQAAWADLLDDAFCR